MPPPAVTSRADDHVPSLVAKLWHFPTISAPDSVEAALQDLLRRDLKIEAARSLRPVPLEKVRHTVTYRLILVWPFLVKVKELPRICGAKQLILEECFNLPISNLTRKIGRNALKHFKAQTK